MKAHRIRGMLQHEIDAASPKDYGTGRICEAVGCMVGLSRYNPLPYCNIHENRYYHETDCMVNENGERQCMLCERWFPPYHTLWYADPRSRDGLDLICRSCRQYGPPIDKGPPSPEALRKRKERERTLHQARQKHYSQRKREQRAKERK